MQRKRTTIQDYRIILRRHLSPYFGATDVAKLTPRDVDAYIAAKRRSGLSVKTITNHLNFAHGVLSFALKRGWVTINAVAMTDRPPSPPADPDIRFLDREELEALLRAAAEDLLGPTDRALWMTAAMTGLRQGELAALRWRDVDWSAGLVRVRRSYSRGHYTSTEEPSLKPRGTHGRSGRRQARASLPAVLPTRATTSSLLSSALRVVRTTRARAACGSKTH